MRDVGIRNLYTLFEFVGKCAQAAAQHHRNLRLQLSAPLYVVFRVLNLAHSSIPAIQADMKFAMVPQATALRPSRARSDFRVGASAPMPPT